MNLSRHKTPSERRQISWYHTHIKIFIANLQNLENDTKPIKKTKSTEMYPGIRKMFKSARGLDPNDFLAIIKFLSTGPHCENTKFYDSQAKRELKKYTKNIKPGMKAKFNASDQFFMKGFHCWFRNSFTIAMILLPWLIGTAWTMS